jgi:PEGA domain
VIGPTRACVLVLVGLLAAAGRPARADDTTAEARQHYETGIALFDAREHEQALIEFEKANEIKPRPAAVFMMAQCEYLLGRLKDARTHYQAYVTEVPDGEFAGLAHDRIESIDRRKSTFVINTVPDDVTVQISEVGMLGPMVAGGQAPNNFSVPRGRYRVDVTKPNYQGQTRIVEVDVAETKPLFFKLEPIPARLEIETVPLGATLYVNGNRARNPYRQDITPGPVEIFAEAPDYEPRAVDLSLAPGEHKLLTGDSRFQLKYRQRSGRSELIAASGVLGAFIGAAAVAAAIGRDLNDLNVSSVLLSTGGGISGAALGVLLATPIVPDYIPDNRALFIIGGMWIGAAEGFGTSVVGYQIVSHERGAAPPCVPQPCRPELGDQLRAGFVGSLAGLGLGLTASALGSKHAPTYGRGWLIQSAAAGGAISGALFQTAMKWKPYGYGWQNTVVRYDETQNKDEAAPMGLPCAQVGNTYGVYDCAVHTTSALDLAPGMLIGLNVGLAAGLLGAYGPDQSHYGPTWQRVLFVDLAAVAGATAGAVFGCVFNVSGCLRAPNPSPDARSIQAWAALSGAAVGAVGGVLGTHHFEDEMPDGRTTSAYAATPPPMVTVAPMRDANGGVVPSFAAMGSF